MTSFVNARYTFFLTSVRGMIFCPRSKGPKAQGLGRAGVPRIGSQTPDAPAVSVTPRPHGRGLLCKNYTVGGNYEGHLRTHRG